MASATWVVRFRRCLFHRAQSSMEKAVMVSCPPRWSSMNGAQKSTSESSPPTRVRRPRMKTATVSADR
uniref:Uncharacterized protein n=1 Tax=Triticum urartu TaxID=4572 RepID=A0A8R7NXG6_TRIUA